MVELLTPRLRLRRARLEDAPALHRVMSTPEAMRYWSSLPHASPAESEAWTQDMIDSSDEDFVVELAGEVVGKAGCYRLPSVGYILRPDCWGQGIATEAMSAIIPYLFGRHPVERLEADVDPRNAASIRLLQKLGFRETGRKARTWEIGGEWCDSVYFALERPSVSPPP
jgi:[ribosomal protein S5]-alanine N-acetyltransferase